MGLILHVKDGKFYRGTKEELLKTIATTWSQIPHRVVNDNERFIEVYAEKTEELLAEFSYDPDPEDLPEHL